jgi:thiol-disulfide isomerase/thioredoxin
MIRINKSLFNSFLILIIALLASCDQESSEREAPIINLSGNISGLSDTVLQFSYETFKLLDTPGVLDIIIDSSGNFDLTIDTKYPLKGFLSIGKIPKTYKFSFTQINGRDTTVQVGSVDFRIVNLYLSPGDYIEMNFDPDNIKNTLSFKGKGADNNEFVNREDWEFNKYKNKYLNNYYYLTYFPAEEFMIRKKEIWEDKKAYLKSFRKDHPLDEHLVHLYTDKYYQEYIGSLIYYPSGHAGFNNGVKAVLPDDYYDFLDEAKIPDNIDDMGAGAFHYLRTLIKKQYELSLSANPETSFYDFVDQKLPERLAFVFKAYALDRDFNKAVYDQFDESCPFPEIAALVKKKYGHLEGMLAGSPFPDFKLEDHKGNIVTPDELTGNFIYIDFWATWCKPCIAEIPHLEKLQEELKNKPIKFISISIDKEKDKSKWIDFVRSNNMKGMQLWADSEHQNIFSKILNIKSIPRFVLLDTEGKIIDAQAPRPSDSKLNRILEEL